MMIAPFPESPQRINGGVAAATTYLSMALSEIDEIDLVGVRVATGRTLRAEGQFNWPIEDLPLERLSLSTLYSRQKARLSTLIQRHRPDIVHAQGTDVAGFVAVGSGIPSVVTVHGLLAECA